MERFVWRAAARAVRAEAPRPARAARRAGELRHVRRVVEDCRGNLSAAARRLGIGRSTLYRKLAGEPG